MHDARAFALRVIRVRKKLLIDSTSRRNAVIIGLALKSVEPWLDAYPYATYQQVRGHLYRKRLAFLTLIPGPKSTLHQKMMQEFTTILNDYPMNTNRSWICREIGGQMFRFSVTISDEAVLIYAVTAGNQTDRDIMHVMDREILLGIKQDLEFQHVNKSA